LPVLSLLGEITSRIISELGPWLWMLFGFTAMIVEIISGRAIALSLALGAMIAGTLAVFGASGVLPATSSTFQSIVFMGASLIIFAAIKLRAKNI
jgi:membrane protein implicated in regulation of membrane protease activity